MEKLGPDGWPVSPYPAKDLLHGGKTPLSAPFEEVSADGCQGTVLRISVLWVDSILHSVPERHARRVAVLDKVPYVGKRMSVASPSIPVTAAGAFTWLTWNQDENMDGHPFRVGFTCCRFASHCASPGYFPSTVLDVERPTNAIPAAIAPARQAMQLTA